MGVLWAVGWFLMNYFGFGVGSDGLKGRLMPSLLWSLLTGGFFAALLLGTDAWARRIASRK
jgi:hypothetical protein